MRSPWRTWTSTRRLVVGRRREDLLLLRRDRRVARDHRRHDAAERLDAERERRDVEEDHVLHVAGEHAGLDRRADRDDLVRVHALVRLLAEELLDRLLARAGCASSRRRARPRRCPSAVFFASCERLLHGLHRALDERRHHLLELRARELHVEVLRAAGAGREERQVDRRLLHARELDLRLLRRLLEALEDHLVLADVDALCPS